MVAKISPESGRGGPCLPARGARLECPPKPSAPVGSGVREAEMRGGRVLTLGSHPHPSPLTVTRGFAIRQRCVVAAESAFYPSNYLKAYRITAKRRSRTSRGERSCRRAPRGANPPRGCLTRAPHEGCKPPGTGQSAQSRAGSGALEVLDPHLNPKNQPRSCFHLAQTVLGHLEQAPGPSPGGWGWAKGSPLGPGASAEGLHCFFFFRVHKSRLFVAPSPGAAQFRLGYK